MKGKIKGYIAPIIVTVLLILYFVVYFGFLISLFPAGLNGFLWFSRLRLPALLFTFALKESKK